MSRRRVYDSIVEHGPSTMRSLTERLTLSNATVRHHLYRLLAEGLVRQCREPAYDHGWPAAVFELTDGAHPAIGERWLAARREGRVLVLDRGRAACAGADPALFFGQGAPARARRICARCPVAVECLDFAIRTEATGYAHGVYGGCTPDERRRIRDNLTVTTQ